MTLPRAVNNTGKKQGSFAQKARRENRSTTHIRIKKQVKFALERLMRKHHVKTVSQMIRKMMEVFECQAQTRSRSA